MTIFLLDQDYRFDSCERRTVERQCHFVCRICKPNTLAHKLTARGLQAGGDRRAKSRHTAPSFVIAPMTLWPVRGPESSGLQRAVV
ncbi:hypothetical protein [Dokdonella sp.]|uniref:hypothetical protein n=1 Tax=Dokdonella sp. TaxID=2291710 RepID=UPI0027B8FC9F|nr:hypothetical protein [Dokdonella sp.]